MSKRFSVVTGILAAGLIALIGCRGGRGYSRQCPCGFVWNYAANGCVVDPNYQPCPDQGGGGSGGSRGSGGGGGGGESFQPVRVPACGLAASGCTFTPDFREGKVELGEPDGSPAGGLVDIKIVAREQSSGKPCTQIAGTTQWPYPSKWMTIPLDAGAAVAMYKGLKGNVKDNCVASQFTIAAAPNGTPECGCVATMFKR